MSRGEVPHAAPPLLPYHVQHRRGAVCTASSHGRAAAFFQEATAAALAVLNSIADKKTSEILPLYY
jgi:hypothetical protein